MVESSSPTLHQVFQNFAAGDAMDGKQFAKLAKDCGLLEKKLTSTDVDLAFAKIKTKAERKITFT